MLTPLGSKFTGKRVNTSVGADWQALSVFLLGGRSVAVISQEPIKVVTRQQRLQCLVFIPLLFYPRKLLGELIKFHPDLVFLFLLQVELVAVESSLLNSFMQRLFDYCLREFVHSFLTPATAK